MVQCGGCWGFMKQVNTMHYNAGYLMCIISQYKVALTAWNEIWGSHDGEYQDYDLLGYDAILQWIGMNILGNLLSPSSDKTTHNITPQKTLIYILNGCLKTGSTSWSDNTIVYFCYLLVLFMIETSFAFSLGWIINIGLLRLITHRTSVWIINFYWTIS
jgi:hypothetical protein